MIPTQYLTYAKTFLARYLLYVVVAIEVLLLPKILAKDTYADFEFIRNTVLLAPYFLLGAHSGYQLVYYKQKQDYFKSLLLGGTTIALLSGIAFSFWLNNPVLSIAMVAVVLATIIEQRYKIGRKFILGLSYKPLVSLLLIALTGLYTLSGLPVSPSTLLILGFGIGVMLYALPLVRKRNELKSESAGKVSLKKDLLTLVQVGLPVSLMTVIFGLHAYTDRLAIQQLDNDALASYSFAFNLAQMVILGLSTISYVATIDIGETMDTRTRETLARSLKRSFGVYLGLLVCLALGMPVLVKFYDLEQLTIITLIIAAAKGLFFVSGSIHSMVMYKGNQIGATLFMGACVLVYISLLYIFQDTLSSAIAILLCSAGISLIYTLSLAGYSLRLAPAKK